MHLSWPQVPSVDGGLPGMRRRNGSDWGNLSPLWLRRVVQRFEVERVARRRGFSMFAGRFYVRCAWVSRECWREQGKTYG